MARGRAGKEILAKIRGEERRKEEGRGGLNDREREGRVRRGMGWLVTDLLSISGCMSEALRLNQIFTHLPPTALPPNYLPSVSLSLSIFFFFLASVPQPLPAASTDNRIILLSCTWILNVCLCCGVWGLCSSQLEITPEKTRMVEMCVLFCMQSVNYINIS